MAEKNYKISGGEEHREADKHGYDCENYGYVCVEHEKLGIFYVSVGMEKNEIRTDGKPWQFLQKSKYLLNEKQIKFVNSHKREILRARI